MRKKLAIFLAMALALGGLPLFAAAKPALASWDWCWDDPTIQIGQQVVSIDVGVPADQANHVSGGTVTVHVPKGVHARVISDAPNTLGLTTTIVADAHGGQSSASVVVKADKNLAVEVQVVEGGTTTTTDGRTNQTITAAISD